MAKLVEDGVGGHNYETISLVSRALNMSCMSLPNFAATIAQTKEKDLDKKTVSVTRTPLFPCVVLVDSHACLAVL